MKILLVNKFYHDKARSGGVGRYLFELQKLLESNGHQVIPFAIADDDVRPSPFLKYFPKAEDYSKVRFNFNGLKSVMKYVRNKEAARKIDALIKAEKPDIVHMHNIYHHLTPSIFKPIRRAGIPVVMTLHDYKLICPNYSLYTNGKNCEKCSGGKYWNCVKYKCVKNSRSASALAASEMFLNRIFKVYEKNVSKFISPSNFMKDICVKFGQEEEKFIKLPYTLEVDQYNPTFRDDGYILYFGRLSPEKGVENLIEAVSLIDKPLELKIAGDGPSKSSIKNKIKKLNLGDKVKLVGFKQGDELKELIANASFVVVPSLWQDNSPLAIYESMLLGKAVIGSDKGGIPELVEDGITGFTFLSESPKDMSEKIVSLLNSPEKANKFGRRARHIALKKYSPEKHYEELMRIYKSVSSQSLQ